MPPRAVGSQPPSNLEEVREDRKVLPFRREAPASAETHESALEGELRELEYQIFSQREQPIPALMARVIERICSITRADGAALALREQQDVFCLASTGDAPDVGSRLRPDSGLTRECFEAGQVVMCTDAERDPRIRPAIAKSLRLGSALAVPICDGAAVVGVIELLSHRPAAFDDVHVVALQSLARSIAPILAPPPVETAEQRSARSWFFVRIAVLLLLLLLLLWWGISRRRRSSSVPRVVVPTVTPAPPAQSEAESEGESKNAAPAESGAANVARPLP